MSLLKVLKAVYGINVRYIYCDNVGENKTLSKKKMMNVKFKYTTPGTPQQNGRVEEKCITLCNRVHAMLSGWKISRFLRMVYGLRQLILHAKGE